MKAATAVIPASAAVTFTAIKTGVIKDGSGNYSAVSYYAVHNGDTVYENDVITVKASLIDCTTPEDTSTEYNGTIDLFGTEK